MSETFANNEMSSVMGLIETHLRLKNQLDNSRRYEIYHPSAFGKCVRYMQYQRYEERGLIKGEPKHFSGQKLRLFDNGHIMHERWKNYFEELGVLRGIWYCKNPMCRMWNDEGVLQGPGSLTQEEILSSNKKHPSRVYGKSELQGVFKPDKCVCGNNSFEYDEVAVEDKELNFYGHADIILDFSRFDPTPFEKAKKDGFQLFFDPEKLPKGVIVVDMKSCGSNQFTNVVRKTGYHKYYGIQLTIYIHVLKCDYGLLIYEEKDQFDLASFKIDPNPAVWEQIRKQAIAMDQMAKSGKNLLPPPRPISKSSFECKDCAFRNHCHRAGGIWDDPELEQKRRDFYGSIL